VVSSMVTFSVVRRLNSSDGLGVEQDEEAGEAVSGAQGVVVQEAAGGLPAGLVVQCPCRALSAGGGEGQRGEALLVGPANEVSCRVAVGHFAARQPAFEIGLAAGRKGQVLGGQPVENNDGGAHMRLCGGVLLVRGDLAVVAAA
jgi:hypothetical protein